jgi:hypothetical protein
LTKSNALKKVRLDFKQADKKARKTIFNYNYNGIAQLGIAFKHLNSEAKRAVILGYLENGQQLSPDMIEWAERHGMNVTKSSSLPE